MLSVFVNIVSQASVEETRRRLRDGLKENAFLAGKIEGHRVVVRRRSADEGLLLGEPRGPSFRGRLVTDEGPVRLRGRVAMATVWRVTAAAVLALLLLTGFGLVAGGIASLVVILLADVVWPAIYYRDTQREIAETLRLLIAGTEGDAAEPGA